MLIMQLHMCELAHAHAHKLGKDSQCSPHVNSKCSSYNKVQLSCHGAARVFLKLTIHAGRLRECTAGRETMLHFIVSVQSMI